MKKVKLFQISLLMTVLFFSCSESEEPLTLVGRWEATTVKSYENNKLYDTYDANDEAVFILIIEESGTLKWEEDGDIDCEGSYGSKMMDSKPQKIDLCGNEGLLTIKSNNSIILSFEYDDEREEVEFKRL